MSDEFENKDKLINNFKVPYGETEIESKWNELESRLMPEEVEAIVRRFMEQTGNEGVRLTLEPSPEPPAEGTIPTFDLGVEPRDPNVLSDDFFTRMKDLTRGQDEILNNEKLEKKIPLVFSKDNPKKNT